MLGKEVSPLVGTREMLTNTLKYPCGAHIAPCGRPWGVDYLSLASHKFTFLELQ